MRREWKAGPFIPSEVWAHTGPAWATTPAVARRHRRVTRAVGARAKRPRSGGNACARATTHASGRQRLRPCDDGCRVGGVFFHKHPKLQHSGDNACVQATMSALAPQRLDLGFETFAFFRALAIQTKLFHYLYLKITGTVLKMVIQSYFY